ncbi:MAG TPA: hypothetical protein VF981_05235 [Gemmatimonadaceae bacterium]
MQYRVRRPGPGRAAIFAAALFLTAAPAISAQGLPARLTDREFWKLIAESSESDGFFQSDNLVSNELSMQVIIPELVKGRAPGGVYIGVGPDQNFTYIAAMRPRIAFIVDIRRMAMVQHLMYKALFEVATDRAEFLSLLFARPRPALATADASPVQLVEAYDAVPRDTSLYWRTLRTMRERLVTYHGFDLDAEDIAMLEYVYTSFHIGGLDLTYNFGQGPGSMRGGRGMPTFGDLMTATDGDGKNRGFLATEAFYGVVRQMHLDNLIVPLVGDFAGPRALRAVGVFLTRHRAVVGAIYTSNVEQYLFREADKWRDYYDNVATLPLDSTSTFVRSVFNFGGGGRSYGSFGARSVTMLQPVLELLGAYRAGRIAGYGDVVGMSRTVW